MNALLRPAGELLFGWGPGGAAYGPKPEPGLYEALVNRLGCRVDVEIIRPVEQPARRPLPVIMSDSLDMSYWDFRSHLTKVFRGPLVQRALERLGG